MRRRAASSGGAGLALDVAVGVAAMVGLAACGPVTATMALPNPARAGNLQATQTYELPPYREDHRYEVTLTRWAPGALGFRLHLVNADRCGLLASYTFSLRDEHGGLHAFQPSSPPVESTRAGHMGALLHDVTWDGTFAVAVDPSTRFVVLEVRPVADRGCTALDFRWDFQP